MEEVIKDVLSEIKPTKEEEKKVNKIVNAMIKKIDRKIKNTKVILGGSGAKGTWLKTFDADIFVRFGYKQYQDKLNFVLNVKNFLESNYISVEWQDAGPPIYTSFIFGSGSDVASVTGSIPEGLSGWDGKFDTSSLQNQDINFESILPVNNFCIIPILRSLYLASFRSRASTSESMSERTAAIAVCSLMSEGIAIIISFTTLFISLGLPIYETYFFDTRANASATHRFAYPLLFIKTPVVISLDHNGPNRN